MKYHVHYPENHIDQWYDDLFEDELRAYQAEQFNDPCLCVTGGCQVH